MTEAVIPHYNRASGELVAEPVHAGRFLSWSYNSVPGWLATDFIFSRRSLSRLYGWLHTLPWSRRKIAPFIERYRIDTAECLHAIEEFESFSDFFIREIDLAHRPVDPNPHACVATNDGRILAFQTIDASSEFEIKRSTFNLSQLLGDPALAARYDGGAMIVSRIYLPDYHHVHFPDSGIAGEARPIGRKYWAVSPHSRRWSIPFFAENFRVITQFDSDHFGPVAMAEIGAFTVGSIPQCYQPGSRMARGDHKSYFELGGSTVVMLFEKGRIEFDDDLLANSEKGVETFVRIGEHIGRTPSVAEAGDEE